jgi:hypothetical protein
MMTSSQESEHWEELYRYWRSRHVGGLPPRRADIDPMIDLSNMASNLILIELRPEGAAYRLVGTDVVRHFGVDHTGKTVGTSGGDPKQIDAWRLSLEVAARDGSPKMLVSHYPGAAKSQAIAMLLPLSPDADGVQRVFGGAFFGRPFPRPDLFPELSIETVTLDV